MRGGKYGREDEEKETADTPFYTCRHVSDAEQRLRSNLD